MGHFAREHNYTSDARSGFGRLRVDVAQTGFFEGREFRTFKELTIAPSTAYIVKVVVPINVILFGLAVAIESGTLRMSTHVGGTAGGSFSETLPIIPANNMSLGADHRSFGGVAYAPVVTLTAGGTHAGDGTTLDVVRLKANANTNQAQSVGDTGGAERGVGAATYYFRLLNESATDTITGIFRARWEERP